jgi:hypothetical protein
MTVDITSATDELRSWVLELNPSLPPSSVTETTPLLSERLINSMHVTELLLVLEELRGEPVDVQKLGPGVFKDIQTIVQTFLVDNP